jgi:hypothetical protein
VVFLAPSADPGVAVPQGVVLPSTAIRAFSILTLTLIFLGKPGGGAGGTLEPGGVFCGSPAVQGRGSHEDVRPRRMGVTVQRVHVVFDLLVVSLVANGLFIPSRLHQITPNRYISV